MSTVSASNFFAQALVLEAERAQKAHAEAADRVGQLLRSGSPVPASDHASLIRAQAFAQIWGDVLTRAQSMDLVEAGRDVRAKVTRELVDGDGRNPSCLVELFAESAKAQAQRVFLRQTGFLER